MDNIDPRLRRVRSRLPLRRGVSLSVESAVRVTARAGEAERREAPTKCDRHLQLIAERPHGLAAGIWLQLGCLGGDGYRPGLIAALRAEHNPSCRRSRSLAVYRPQTTFHPCPPHPWRLRFSLESPPARRTRPQRVFRTSERRRVGTRRVYENEFTRFLTRIQFRKRIGEVGGGSAT
jgi:hypothetical protein